MYCPKLVLVGIPDDAKLLLIISSKPVRSSFTFYKNRSATAHHFPTHHGPWHRFPKSPILRQKACA
jgi:hypothetical protein